MPVHYDDKGRVLKPFIKREWTEKMILEYTKCVRSVKYFVLNHCKVAHPTKGIMNLELRDYQMRMLDIIDKNNKICMCTGRQIGKCVVYNTKIRIKNKKTNEIKELTVKEFYNLIK